MANETSYTPAKYGGNGVNQDFSFTWRALKKEEIKVVLEDSEGEQTTLTQGSDYTLTLNNVGGSVHTTIAPANGYYIIISRNTSLYQTTKYSTSTGFQGSEIEKSFDRNSLCLQEMKYTIGTFREEFLFRLGEANQNIYNLLDDAEDLVEKADYTLDKATEQADRAEQYADSAEFGMKWISFTTSNWVADNDKYKLTLNDVPLVNAIYKGTFSNKKLIKNCDIKVSDTSCVITSMAAFDGFALTSSSVLGLYTHEQTLASDEWIIDHNTGHYPCVTLVDTNNTVMVGTVQYVTLNRIKVTFESAVSGKAFLR